MYLKQSAIALDLSTVQPLNMNTLLRGVESCWVKFETGQTFAQHGSTFPLLCGSTKSSAFAQQSSTCWAHARAVSSVSIGSLNISNILQDGVARVRSSTGKFKWEKFYGFCVDFLPFCANQYASLLEVQPSIFVFWGDECLRVQFSHDSTWAFVKSSECSTCWVIVEVIWTPHSTNIQHVESLNSGQIQHLHAA